MKFVGIGVLACVLAVGAAHAEEITLSASRGVNETVDLSWSGGAPSYAVYRGTAAPRRPAS